MQLSDARQISTGYCALFNNVGANTFTVLDAQGNVLMAPTSGQVWQIYLADNSTLQGTWRVFQYGAGVSSANAASLAGSGLKAITTTLNERIFINAQAANYVIGSGAGQDRATCVEWTGGSGGTFTAPAPATVGSDWFCYVKNSGTGTLTLSGTIDGSAGKTFNPNDSCILVSDGANLFTMGFGQSVASSFNFVTISLAGATGTVVLAGAQLNRISYKFTGALAGNVTVQVPASIQQYWVDNETTGAFTLTVSTGAGSTFTVPQATRVILYCDGLNIVNAVSSGAGSVTLVADGTAAAPGLAWASDAQMGLYKVGPDILGVSTAGVQRATINATGNIVVNAPSAGNALQVFAPPAIAGFAGIFTSGTGASGTQFGLGVNAGTTSADTAFIVNNQPGTTPYFRIRGDGSWNVPILAATGATAATSFITPAADATLYSLLGRTQAGPGIQARWDSATTNRYLQIGAYDNVGTWSPQIQINGSSGFGISGQGPIAAAMVDMTPDTGTFVVTYVGGATAPTGTAVWTRSGKLVILYLPTLTATSNSAAFAYSGLPATLQPATLGQAVGLGGVVNNGVSEAGGFATVSPGTGSIVFARGVAAAWTNAGPKSLSNNTPIAYLLN
jgi:hypothetical protein